MKRATVIALLSVGIGIPSTLGVTEVCSTKSFDQTWRQHVRDILTWNKKHPDVVKRRHLDRDMSAETRRAKERLRKRLEMACVPQEGQKAYSSAGNIDFGFEPLENAVEVWGGGSLHLVNPHADLTPSITTDLIPSENLPTYDNPERTYDSPALGAVGIPGWFSGGYVGGSGASGNSGNSVGVAATPEPLPVGLVAFGAAFLIIRGRKEGQ